MLCNEICRERTGHLKFTAEFTGKRSKLVEGVVRGTLSILHTYKLWEEVTSVYLSMLFDVNNLDKERHQLSGLLPVVQSMQVTCEPLRSKLGAQYFSKTICWLNVTILCESQQHFNFTFPCPSECQPDMIFFY